MSDHQVYAITKIKTNPASTNQIPLYPWKSFTNPIVIINIVKAAKIGHGLTVTI
jgi:hypothetical protein